MKNQIRELSPKKQNCEPDNGAATLAQAELGEKELSQVSGGKGSSLALKCATGKHFAEATITA